jgi:hypothetical protein
LNSGRHGIRAVQGIVEDNVVAFNPRGDGIRVGFQSEPGAPAIGFDIGVRRNTVVGCQGTGLLVRYLPAAVIEQNIIAFNGIGLDCDGDIPSLVVSCNDAFGNADGDFARFCAGAAGVDGNVSLDPLFCDGESGNFQLARSSPCAPDNSNGCGLIGALPAALCSTVGGDFLKRGPDDRAARTESRSWGQVKSIFR